MAGGVQDSGGGGADADGGDNGRHWLADEKSDFRHNMVEHIAKKLTKFHQGDSEEIHCFAAKVEEDAFSRANSMGDYTKNTSEKLKNMEKEGLTQIKIQGGNSVAARLQSGMLEEAMMSSPKDLSKDKFQQEWYVNHLLRTVKEVKDANPNMITEHESQNCPEEPQMVNLISAAAPFPSDESRQQQQQEQSADVSPSFSVNSLEDQVQCEGSETKNPFDSLVNAMRASSPGALCRSFESIWPVISKNDSVSVGKFGAFTGCTFRHGGSRVVNQMRGVFESMDGHFMASECDALDTESSREHDVKRQRVQSAKDALLEEIEAINRNLIDTVISVATDNGMDGITSCDGGTVISVATDNGDGITSCDGGTVISVATDNGMDGITSCDGGTVISVATDNGMDGITSCDGGTVISVATDNGVDGITSCDGGTVIKLSYSAVSVSPDLRSLFAASGKYTVMPIELLVPMDYPISSPVLRDDKGDDQLRKKSGVILDSVDPAFRLAISKLPEPRSIKEIVSAWDTCVRNAVIEFARQHGGGTFSSVYGKWRTLDPSEM